MIHRVSVCARLRVGPTSPHAARLVPFSQPGEQRTNRQRISRHLTLSHTVFRFQLRWCSQATGICRWTRLPGPGIAR